MKKLLYITCNSKPEKLSASKTVGRACIDAWLEKDNTIQVKELDLYQMHLPKLKYRYFKDRNSVVDKEDYNALPENEQKDVDRIIELSQEFRDADYYVIAAPMWNLMFPAPLKEYMDCILQNDILMKIDPIQVTGLLGDKERIMVYIQSSGGGIPWILERKMNHGGTYLKDIFKFVGIKHFYEVLVDKTGYTAEEQDKAVKKGIEEVKAVIAKNQ